jgi:hypothetical protein
MSALTEDFMRLPAARRHVAECPLCSAHTREGQMMIRWTEVGFAIAITAFALLFVYCVIFAFRTGYVGAPF